MRIRLLPRRQRSAVPISNHGYRFTENALTNSASADEEEERKELSSGVADTRVSAQRAPPHEAFFRAARIVFLSVDVWRSGHARGAGASSAVAHASMAGALDHATGCAEKRVRCVSFSEAFHARDGAAALRRSRHG